MLYMRISTKNSVFTVLDEHLPYIIQLQRERERERERERGGGQRGRWGGGGGRE